VEGLSNDQKLQALLGQLSERYSAAHRMRERSTQFALWISGMAIALAWALLCQPSLSRSEKWAITLLAAALLGGTLYLLGALWRGFRNNHRAMINVERALRMHEEGAYLPGERLLPAEYAKPTQRWSGHFLTLFAWLALVAVSLAVLTWARPTSRTHQLPKPKLQQAEEGNEHG
jgi:hypothetical protein